MSLPESSRLSPFSSLAFFEVLGAHPFLTAKSMMKVPVHTAWDGRGRVRETGQREKKKRDSCVSVTVAQKPKMMSRTDKRGEEKGQLTMFSLDPMNPPLFKCSESQSQRIILFAAILARGAKLCEDGARASLRRNSRGRQWRVARERERERMTRGRRVARGRGLRLKSAVHTPSTPPSPPEHSSRGVLTLADTRTRGLVATALLLPRQTLLDAFMLMVRDPVGLSVCQSARACPRVSRNSHSPRSASGTSNDIGDQRQIRGSAKTAFLLWRGTNRADKISGNLRKS